MAKNSLFGGKNGVQQSAHIRQTKYPDGNQGFNTMNVGSVGGDTVPGPMKGAPLSTKVRQTTSSKKVERDGMNPFNRYEGNKPGVLGADIVKQDAGRTLDSPVPELAQRPDIGIKSKAAEVAHASAGAEGFHPEGVLGRG